MTMVTSPSLRPPAAGSAVKRFAFIDALRGLAAIGVMCHHFEKYGPLREEQFALLPDWLRAAMVHGWIGVPFFFAISGFVIAYSARDMAVGVRSAANFVGRRFLRLSPPYYFTLALVSVMAMIAIRFFDDASLDEWPTWPRLLAHLGYLHKVLGNYWPEVFGELSISTGFWMLFIEMQFYVGFVLLLWAAQAVSARRQGAQSHSWADANHAKHSVPGHGPKIGTPPPAQSPAAIFLAFVPLGVWSVLGLGRNVDLDMWLPFYFGLIVPGILCWWCVDGRLPRWVFWGFLIVLAARGGLEFAAYADPSNLDPSFNGTEKIVVALIAALAIYAAARTGHLHDWLAAWPLQYFGRISYSLFLIHYPVGWLVRSVGQWLTGDAVWPALGWLGLSIAISIVAAHAMAVWIEEPAARWARRLGTAR